MRQLCRKECVVTLVAFLLVTVMTHIFPLYFLFPELTQMTLFGFPANYMLAILLSWIVMLPAYYLYIVISESIDREIARTSLAEAEEAEEAAAAVAAGGLAPAHGGD